MKQFWAVLACVAVMGLTSTVSATTYTETVTLDRWLAEGKVASWIMALIDYTPTSTYSYEHSTPSDFEVPYDLVNSATLTIYASYVNGDDDVIYLNGTLVGTLVDNDISWSWWSGWESDTLGTDIDLASIFSLWETGDTLTVSIDSNGSLGDGVLYLEKSVLSLDYTNESAPVPEPTTMLLFGTGIAGLAAFSRRKKD